MLDVFYTVDVEVWCDGWLDIDRKFPEAFRRYVYGPTPQGDYGLPHQLRVLRDHGLLGVFYTEPLFSLRFGRGPLAEIVGLIRDAGHEVQLHLHTEWVDEAESPPVPLVGRKRQHLRNFSLGDQKILIGIGRNLLREAGAPTLTAFRAGSFGFNRDTLAALAANGMPFDSSYNACTSGLSSGVMPGVPVVDVLECDGVAEYPMTCFDDGTSTLRPAQLTACSFAELEGLLWRALEEERKSFTILSHNFELLNTKQNGLDPVVAGRFRKLCAFLDRNRDSFRVAGFMDRTPRYAVPMPMPLRSSSWHTALRMMQQAYRRRYG